MAKKFFNTKCIHCCQHFDELTSDHIFPKSWYPDGTPDNIEKWQAPSCDRCNKDMGKIENELLIQFGLGLSPKNEASSGIPQKSLNALNHERGKNKKDSLARFRKKVKILNEVIPAENFHASSIIPNKSTNSDSSDDGMLIDARNLELIGAKLIKGITWIKTKQYIDDRFSIKIHIFENSDVNAFTESLQKFGKTFSLGNGIKVTRFIVPEEPICGIYKMVLWDSITLHGTVLLTNRETQHQ